MAHFGSNRAGLLIEPAHGTRGSNRTLKLDAEKAEKPKPTAKAKTEKPEAAKPKTEKPKAAKPKAGKEK
jgi:hypothetical protein